MYSLICTVFITKHSKQKAMGEIGHTYTSGSPFVRFGVRVRGGYLLQRQGCKRFSSNCCRITPVGLPPQRVSINTPWLWPPGSEKRDRGQMWEVSLFERKTSWITKRHTDVHHPPCKVETNIRNTAWNGLHFIWGKPRYHNSRFW